MSLFKSIKYQVKTFKILLKDDNEFLIFQMNFYLIISCGQT